MPLDWGGLAGRGWPPPFCVLGEPDGLAGCSFGSLLPVVLFFFGFLPVVLWAEPLDVVGGVGSALAVWGDVVKFEVAGCGAVWVVAGVWQVAFGPGLEFVIAGCSVAVGVGPCHCACLLLLFVPCSGHEPAARPVRLPCAMVFSGYEKSLVALPLWARTRGSQGSLYSLA